MICHNNADCPPNYECQNNLCLEKGVDGGDVHLGDVEQLADTGIYEGKIEIEHDKIDFGSAPFGVEVKREVLIKNIGQGELVINEIKFTPDTNPDPNNPRFKVISEKETPFSIESNSTERLEIIYKQDDEEPDNGFLVINSSDITRPSVKVFMYSSYKNEPDLEIVDKSTSPPKLLYPESGATNTYGIDLGNVPLDNTKEMMVTLYNQSEDGIISIKSANIFQMSKNKIEIEWRSTIDPNIKYSAPFYINAKEMVDLYIKYVPKVEEKSELTRIELVTNDKDINNDYIDDNGVLTINIIGQAGYVSPKINVDKTEINFGEVQVGMSAKDIFNICNSGEDILQIDGTSGFDNLNTNFSMSPSKLGGSLLGGACIEVKVKFTPTTTGNQFNKIVIKSNDPNNPIVEVRLYGIGTDPNLVITPPDKNIDFGIIEVGKESAVKSFTISNTGKGSLSINSIALSVGSSSDFILVNLPVQFPVIIKGDGHEIISFGVKFKPSISSDPNQIKGAIEIKSSDKDNQIVYINLAGIGFACPTGFSDCDNDLSDRCETNINTSLSHCGFCNNSCNVEHGTPVCSNGNCGIASCDQFWADCDKLYDNGCEASLETDINNCGICGFVCKFNNAQPKCVNKTCMIDYCLGTFRDCNHNQSDGCEIDTGNDINNCGECGNRCNSNALCSNSSCVCNIGYGNCDNDWSNGCEANLSLVNSCGRDCSNIKNCELTVKNVTKIFCNSGSCDYVSCIYSYEDKDNDRTNGCEYWNYFPKTYGGIGDDWATSIQQTSDGGFVVLGYTNSFGAGNSDFWVIRLNNNGDIIWQKTYGGSDYDYAFPIQQTSDGRFIVAGTDFFGAGGPDFWVLKLDSDGKLLGNCGNIEQTSNATVTNTTISPANSNAIVTNTNATINNTTVSPQKTNCTVQMQCTAP